MEIGLAIVIGGGIGVVIGLLFGGNRFLGAAFEPYLAALAATPKIVVLPILYLMLGIGTAPKVAIGAFACLVPVALSTAAGMRQVSPVLVRVGTSFDLSQWQMVLVIYLPLVNRLGRNRKRAAVDRVPAVARHGDAVGLSPRA